MLQLGEADGLIAYDMDRVARNQGDLEDLVDVVEQAEIPVESVPGSLRMSSVVVTRAEVPDESCSSGTTALGRVIPMPSVCRGRCGRTSPSRR
jgi:hypothetical protein